MAWIESHQELGRHPKLRKLSRNLGISYAAAVGHLHFLWWWALDFAQDGDLSRYDAKDIAEGATWDGDAEQFLEELVAVGFVDNVDGVLTLHDWEEFAGRLLERRKKDRERKRVARENDAGATGRKTSDGLPTDGDGSPDQPYITEHNQTEDDSTDNTGENKTTSPKTADERFAIFWEAYPKKVGKKNCVTIWKRLKMNDKLFQTIMKALEAQKQSSQWTRDGGKFIPNPQTWLNGQRWEDEVMAQQKQGGGNGKAAEQGGGVLSGFHSIDD